MSHLVQPGICNVWMYVREISNMSRWQLFSRHLADDIWTNTMGKFDLGGLAAVSYRGKKVRTAASSAVRSVNKSRDTRNCVQNEPEYVICVRFTTLLYHKALEIIVCALIWQTRHNYNRLDDGHSDVTGHRKMSALGTASAMVTTHENSTMIWSFKGPIFYRFLKPIGNEKEWRASHCGVVYKLNLISNMSRISDWSVHFASYFFHSTGTFAVSTDSPLLR